MRALLSAVVVVALLAGPIQAARAQTIGEKLDDTAITTKVKAKLTKERAKNLVAVKVKTQDGVVHLEGTVPTEADKAEAERLVRDTSGVKDVTNDLQVASTGTTPSPAASPGAPPTK